MPAFWAAGGPFGAVRSRSAAPNAERSPRHRCLHFSNLKGSEGKDRNGRQGWPLETRVGPTALDSGCGRPCRNFYGIPWKNHVERVSNIRGRYHPHRRAIQQGSCAVVARSALCVCVYECLCVSTWERARTQACGGSMGGEIGSDQMYRCVCVDEHVLRGDPEGESTACEVSCVCARGRHCSAMRGCVKACV